MVTTTNVIDVIIGNTFAVATTVDPTNIASKAIQFTSIKDYTYAVDGAGMATKGAFVILQGNGAGNPPRVSSVIDPVDVISWQKLPVTAAAAQVTTLALETPVAGKEYIVYLVDLQDFEYVNKPRKRYSVIAATGETAATLGAKFITLINTDLSRFCTASGGASLVLTGIARDAVSKVYETNFKVALGGSFTSTTTITYTTAPTKGVGTYDQVFELEEKYKGYKGSMNRSEYDVVPTYYADSSKTYISFIIRHRRRIATYAAGREGMGDLITTYLYMDAAGGATITGSATGSVEAALVGILGASKEIKSL